MIDSFVGFCLHHRISVIVLAMLLALFGVYAWETLSVEAYPELGDVAAQVTTQMPGLAAEEVEQLIAAAARPPVPPLRRAGQRDIDLLGFMMMRRIGHARPEQQHPAGQPVARHGSL
jgi:hypothetical protein